MIKLFISIDDQCYLNSRDVLGIFIGLCYTKLIINMCDYVITCYTIKMGKKGNGVYRSFTTVMTMLPQYNFHSWSQRTQSDKTPHTAIHSSTGTSLCQAYFDIVCF